MISKILFTQFGFHIEESWEHCVFFRLINESRGGDA